jgi:hypothetical protein
MHPIDEILAPANWELTSPREKLFSSDHVIDAYLKGKNDGLEQQQKLIIEKLESNLNKAGKDTAEILAFLSENNLHPSEAYLRINSWDDFSVLIVLPQDEFLDPRMLEVYAHITQLESKVEEAMYHIQVSFCDTEDNIDEHYIRSDGFSLKYKFGE